MRQLGKNIVVVGVSASGKSTLARQLGEKLGVAVTFVDSIMWKPGWVYVGDDATAKQLTELSNRPEWIIEGYIVSDAREAIFEKASTIMYLDYPRPVAVWRYLKRYWKHRTHPRAELEGSPEKFSFEFLKRVWRKGEAISLDKDLAKVTDQTKIMRLHSLAETRKFLAGIKM